MTACRATRWRATSIPNSGLKRVALLRVNDRYGRFGVAKFRDASRRLGHPVVIEQKFMPGDTDFRRQLAGHQRLPRRWHRALDRHRRRPP
jgi:ABC-type branched-subunit amino acid transport system substrate-binding protein